MVVFRHADEVDKKLTPEFWLEWDSKSPKIVFFSRFALLLFFILSSTMTMTNRTGAVQLTINKGELNMHEMAGGTTFSPIFQWWDCFFIETDSFATANLFFDANCSGEKERNATTTTTQPHQTTMTMTTMVTVASNLSP